VPKLNQILAIEKGVKNRVTSNVTQLYHAAQKPVLFDGFSKQFRPKAEDGETFPPEQKEVQFKADSVLKKVRKNLTELFDVTATKDWANCDAKADVKVGDTKVLEGVPVTYLLFLEKQLEHLGTVVGSMPTLDTSLKWNKDENQGTFVSDPQTTHKTKKVQRPIVKYDATKEHPAQTEIITDDVIIGHWDTVHSSGRMQTPAKEEVQDRIVSLQQAVKQAREEANSADAPKQTVGDQVLGFIFG
jgi:hypothetical protein